MQKNSMWKQLLLFAQWKDIYLYIYTWFLHFIWFDEWFNPSYPLGFRMREFSTIVLQNRVRHWEKWLTTFVALDHNEMYYTVWCAYISKYKNTNLSDLRIRPHKFSALCDIRPSLVGSIFCILLVKFISFWFNDTGRERLYRSRYFQLKMSSYDSPWIVDCFYIIFLIFYENHSRTSIICIWTPISKY